jgi:hypothetical protein
MGAAGTIVVRQDHDVGAVKEVAVGRAPFAGAHRAGGRAEAQLDQAVDVLFAFGDQDRTVTIVPLVEAIGDRIGAVQPDRNFSWSGSHRSCVNAFFGAQRSTRNRIAPSSAR